MSKHSSSNRKPDASTEVVVLTRYGQHLSVPRPCQEITAPLSTRVLRAVRDDQHGCRIAAVLEPLLDPVEPPRPPNPDRRLPIATAGLEPIVTHMAKEAGYKVERRWYSPPPSLLPEPSLAAPRWSGTCDEHVLRFVHDHERGLIRHVPGNVDLIHLITEIALAFPGATMVVTTATNKTARKVYGRLLKSIACVTLATSKHCPPDPGRIVVATFAALAHPEIECEKRGIVIAMDAVELIGERGQEAMLMADARFKLFGFLAANREPAPYDKDRISAMFGLEEVLIPRHGHQPIQVSVAWTPICAPALPHGAGLLQVKRNGICRNHVRNRRVAGLATALTAGNRKLLRDKYPSVADAIEAEGPVRVAVMVEAVDHALELADKLRNWPVRTGPEVT
ncbi:hypothetical protein ACFL5Q_07120, partial [Planctomycetota bacterium]